MFKSNVFDDSNLIEFYIDASVSLNQKRVIHAFTNNEGKLVRAIYRQSIKGEKIDSMLSELKTIKYLLQYLTEETNIRKIKIYCDSEMVVKKYIQNKEIKDQKFNRKLQEIKNIVRFNKIFLKIIYIVREKNLADYFTKFENIHQYKVIKTEYDGKKKTYSSESNIDFEELKNQQSKLEKRIDLFLTEFKVNDKDELRKKVNDVIQTLSDLNSLKKFIP